MNCNDADSVVVGSEDQTHECFLVASVLVVADYFVAIASPVPALHFPNPLLLRSVL